MRLDVLERRVAELAPSDGTPDRRLGELKAAGTLVHPQERRQEWRRSRRPRQEWQAELSPEQYQIVREKGTEAPFTSELNDEKAEGTFKCVACGQPLFSSEHKFDSGTGWPSFDEPMDDEAVETEADNSLFMRAPRSCAHAATPTWATSSTTAPPTRPASATASTAAR